MRAGLTEPGLSGEHKEEADTEQEKCNLRFPARGVEQDIEKALVALGMKRRPLHLRRPHKARATEHNTAKRNASQRKMDPNNRTWS